MMEGLNQEDVARIREEAARMDDEGMGGLGPLSREMLENWKEFSPKMYQRLKGQGILEEFAIVREGRYRKAVERAMREGPMSRSDAEREYAGMLLMESELSEEPDEYIEQLD